MKMLYHTLQDRALTDANRPAICHGSTVYTYRRLNDLANHVAHDLIGRHNGHGGLVSVLSLDPAVQLIATFGAWKAGMTVLVLDAHDPDARLRQILESSGTSLVITSADSIDVASRLSEDFLLFSPERSEPAPANPNIVIKVTNQPAAVTYTSGSTGSPKGIVRTHEQILEEVQRDIIGFGIREKDHVSLMMPLNFSFGLKIPLVSLQIGAPLYSFDAVELGIAPFSDWIRDKQINILLPPTGFFRRFLDNAWKSAGPFPFCRRVVLGDRFYPQDVLKFRKLFGTECELMFTYGSTETGQISSHCLDGITSIPDHIPVGRPVDKVSVRIVDEEGNEKSKGRKGEIVVVSNNLPLGYWLDPELTAKKYKTIPGSDERTYLTGDIGAVDKDDMLYLYGRKDNQLKISGFRVNTGEIENILHNVKGVASAVVTVSENTAGDKNLTAFISPSAGVTLQPQTVNGILANSLPRYMLPNSVVIINEIPINSRGKVDRKALASIPTTAERVSDSRSATETERKVIEVWQEVFDIADISTGDDIIDLGVKSLDAMVMCVKLGRIYSVDVPYSQLVLSPTVEKLAAFIDKEIGQS